MTNSLDRHLHVAPAGITAPRKMFGMPGKCTAVNQAAHLFSHPKLQIFWIHVSFLFVREKNGGGGKLTRKAGGGDKKEKNRGE
jgi:hypothetical protein